MAQYTKRITVLLLVGTSISLILLSASVLGFILVIPIITHLRESGVFLTNRIQLLSTPLAVRREEAANRHNN